MPLVTYIAADGTSTTTEVAVGENVMRGALYGNIEGIAGECGGACSCATCHVYVDAAWIDRVADSRTEVETELLEGAAAEVTGASRLSCQIVMTEALGGLVVHMPEHQY